MLTKGSSHADVCIYARQAGKQNGNGIAIATAAAILALNTSAVTFDLAFPAHAHADDEVSA